MLTKTEAKLAAALLEMASETYSNHGCNDFDVVSAIGITNKESKELWKKLTKWNGGNDEIGSGPIHIDWILMSYLASRLQEESEGQ